MINATCSRARSSSSRSGVAAFGMAELAELGGDVPYWEAGMCVEDGIDVPSLLPTCNGYQGLVACLSPCPNILSSLLESSSQCIGCLLVEAVQRVAVHIVSHFRLVNVAGTRLLCVPKYLVCHLYTKHTNITVSQYLSSWTLEKGYCFFQLISEFSLIRGL